jgi:N-formylglutamate amidohydrolase/phosphoribosylformylglycinamidine (FGAM) synthase-like amidotransferase family enzyme
MPFPSRWCALWLVAWLSVGTAAAQSVAKKPPEVARFVTTQTGQLPIILSAPHGGALVIPDVEAREGKGLAKAPGGFVTARDTGTEELAQEVSRAIEARFGKRPYLVAARSHRQFADMNRPAEQAYEDPDAKPVYDFYHQSLARACRDVQQTFRTGLLLDLHGQGTAKDTVFRGTKNGLTVVLLRERFGEAAHTGTESLWGSLKSRGWKVHPDPHDGKEQAGFTGGYIVQTYGSQQGFGIDAVQLEFGGDYRSAEARAKTAAVLADAIAEYAKRYLTIEPAFRKPTGPTIDVAVYKGDGASASREELLKALATEPRFQVRDVTVDDIRGGKLADVEVLIHPGGSGGGQGRALGEEGRKVVREFVEAGGGYVGVCAGAYLATCDYDWSLNILDARVLDRKHWNRGFGTVEIALTDKGRELLGVKEWQLPIYYHQGPLLAPAEKPDVADYDGLATYRTEIAKNGASEGVMPGTTAIASGVHHKGRVFCFSPHPEKTAGLEPLLVRAVWWTADGDPRRN